MNWMFVLIVSHSWNLLTPTGASSLINKSVLCSARPSRTLDVSTVVTVTGRCQSAKDIYIWNKVFCFWMPVKVPVISERDCLIICLLLVIDHWSDLMFLLIRSSFIRAPFCLNNNNSLSHCHVVLIHDDRFTESPLAHTELHTAFSLF